MGTIGVVDLFAGPGGLAEGFSRFGKSFRSSTDFNIVLSAEKDRFAHSTLQLRSFYRHCERAGHVPESYFDFARGQNLSPFTSRTIDAWKAAAAEALHITLGNPTDDQLLAATIAKRLKSREWVLIGGPPCQAYSLVGRARNRGTQSYRPEADARHYLYREYLSVLAKKNPPAVFVMENVKGILTSRVEGQLIFPQMLRDLASPRAALGTSGGHTYTIHSIAQPDCSYRNGDDPHAIDASNFVVRAENHGVPQTRHRVILVGVRDDISVAPRPLDVRAGELTVADLLNGLPKICSKLSSPGDWAESISASLADAQSRGLDRDLDAAVNVQMRRALPKLATMARKGPGSAFVEADAAFSPAVPADLARWLSSSRLGGVVDHTSRGHMPSDLLRYLFCAAFARVHKRSPRAADFPDSLAPLHENWGSGKFVDRFKVQIGSRPASTVTSHIAKDGHYFIHPDPCQVRSLTVREAARLQTFSDDYVFLGPRTARYSQVGNAVPPFLATQIAASVASVLT